jgi:hypothetical protein
MVYRCDKNIKITMSQLSPRCTARSRRSRALISLVGQHVLVELGISCATLVVPEMGGEGKQKITPFFRSSKAPSRSTRTLVRDNSWSSRRSRPPSIGLSLPPGRGKKTIATTGCHLSLPMPRLSCPGRLLAFSGTGWSEQYRPYPLLVVHATWGRLFGGGVLLRWP